MCGLGVRLLVDLQYSMCGLGVRLLIDLQYVWPWGTVVKLHDVYVCIIQNICFILVHI